MDSGTIRMVVPEFLVLLVIPTGLLLLWTWQLWRRRIDVGRLVRGQTTPIRERYRFAGPLVFWLFLNAALFCCIVALARPEILRSVTETRTVDLIIVQDGSASMRVSDVRPSRWQRSVAWMRTLVEMLSWKGDRVAFAVFAQHAAPQVRLARDPNILLFFLDHLAKEPPNALADDSTWDTNVEAGIYWGLKIAAKDEEIHGKTSNPQALVVISDGQIWSGEVATSLAMARRRRIPVYVVGVGTSSGGVIPTSNIRAMLDRESLQRIASLGEGHYFEIGRQPDKAIAARIIQDVQRLGSRSAGQPVFEEMYWRFLAAAAGFLAAGVFFHR